MSEQQKTFGYHMPTINRQDAEIIRDILLERAFISDVRIDEMFDPYSGASMGFHVTCEGSGDSRDAFVAAVKQALWER